MTAHVTCSFCRGSKEAETWRTLDLTPGSLIRPDLTKRSDYSPDLVDLITNGETFGGQIARVNWETVPCPRCNGQGSYPVESVTCKIF